MRGAKTGLSRGEGEPGEAVNDVVRTVDVAVEVREVRRGEPCLRRSINRGSACGFILFV